MSYFSRNDPKCRDLDLEFEFRCFNMFFGHFRRFENTYFWIADFLFADFIIFSYQLFCQGITNSIFYGAAMLHFRV